MWGSSENESELAKSRLKSIRTRLESGEHINTIIDEHSTDFISSVTSMAIFLFFLLLGLYLTSSIDETFSFWGLGILGGILILQIYLALRRKHLIKMKRARDLENL